MTIERQLLSELQGAQEDRRLLLKLEEKLGDRRENQLMRLEEAAQLETMLMKRFSMPLTGSHKVETME